MKRITGPAGLVDLLCAAALGLLASAAATPSGAAPRLVIPPGLQSAALLCIGEALKLCPGALTTKDHGIGCIRTKRRLLSRPCQGVYDQGVSVLNGGDVHLDLRALRGKPAGAAPKPKPAPEPAAK